MRITIQWVVSINGRQNSTTEALNDPEPYQKFFIALEKSMFLIAHEVD